MFFLLAAATTTAAAATTSHDKATISAIYPGQKNMNNSFMKFEPCPTIFDVYLFLGLSI